MTDRDGARTQAVQEIFDALAIHGGVQLGVLTDIEECVLGAGRWLMTDPRVWAQWREVPEAVRRDIGHKVVTGMEERGLIVDRIANGDAETLVPNPWLSTVIRVRTGPSFIVAPLERDEGPEVPYPLAYGIVDETGLVAFAVEVRGGGSHHYRLVSPWRTANGVAQWIEERLVAPAGGSSAGPLVMGVLSGATDIGAQVKALIVDVGDHPGVRVLDEDSGELAACPTTEALADALLNVFYGVSDTLSSLQTVN